MTGTTARINQSAAAHFDVTPNSTLFKTLSFQETQKILQKAFNLQDAVTIIGVLCIVDSMEEQYVIKLNKDTLDTPTRPSSPCSHTYA
jgi:hypothetical protein